MIGDNTEVTMLSSTGKQCRVGFEAPDDTSVHRKKIYDRIQMEKQEKMKTEED